MIRDRETPCKGECIKKPRFSGPSEHFLACGFPPSRHSAILAKKRRMSDLREQLAVLRQRVAHIDQKYEAGGQKYEARANAPRTPSFVEEFLSGEQVETG